MTYALDTNIISFFLKDNEAVHGRFRQVLTDGNRLIIPPIVYYEIKRGFLLNPSPNKEKIFDKMCQAYEVGRLDNRLLEPSAQIYANARLKTGHNIKDADIFIAVFCILSGYTLVTNNTKDFEFARDFHGLKLEDWSQI